MSMIYPKITALLASAMLVLGVAPAAARSAENASDPAWTIHSSFYNQPRRVIDSPAHTYFFVHPGVYNNQNYAKYYADVAGTLFFVDKNNHAAGMQDLAKAVNLTGFNMRLVEANHSDGTLAVAYTDGGLDLISPDGTVTYFADLRNASNYLLSTINNLTFDRATGDLYVATQGGFIVIDGTTHTIKHFADWRQPVTDVIPVGTGCVAVINGRICQLAPGADVADRNAYSEIAGATPVTPLRLLAFSGNHFGFVGKGGEFYTLSRSGTNWSLTSRGTHSTILKQANVSVANQIEHTVHPIDGGYAITSNSKIYTLTCPTPDAAPEYNTLALPSGCTQYMGTGDGKTFWIYNILGKFVEFTHDGTSWKQVSETMVPAAPHTAKDVYFLHSPAHGFLCVNKPNSLKSNNVEATMPITIDSYRNGVWTDLSPRKEMPYFIAGDPAKEQLFRANKWYPLNAANGCLIDPKNPDVLLAGSIWDGFAALYLDDPRKQPHVHVTPNSTYIANFGAVPMFPQSTWGNYAGIYLLGDDADGNIWATRSNLYPTDGTTQSLSQLWVWTNEAREQALKDDAPATAGAWKRMEVEGGAFTEFYVIGAALKHPKNKNKFLLNGQMSNSKGRFLRIHDTKGTFDNSSDDTITDINYFVRDDGSRGSAGNIVCYWEDPDNGEVYVFTGDDLYILDLDNEGTSNTMYARSLALETEEGNRFIPFNPTRAYAICQDEYGRLWIGSEKSGVYGISADRKRVVANFNRDNSPLPSNTIYGLGWNPETKSLFVSTAEIIAEVKVDAPQPAGANSTGEPITLTPASVGPDFAGTVAIHNVPAGVSLRVRDREGRSIAILDNTVNGLAYWNLLDEDGNHVPTGVYTISDASGRPTFEPVTLPVIR